MNEYMHLAKQTAQMGMRRGEGGPFGAVITNEKGEVISIGNNQVLKENDPTAHAEIVAIRDACKKLNTYDLSKYVLYTSCEPCPMCLSAIIWANIKNVYFGCTKDDAGNIGFSDDIIYDAYQNNVTKIKDLLIKKNTDYGNAWKSMSIISMTDQVIIRVYRIRKILSNDGQCTISEGITAQLNDIINYCVFALIKMKTNLFSF